MIEAGWWKDAILNILLVHQSYPAQFVHLASALKRRGDELIAICRKGKGTVIGNRGTQVANLAPYALKRGNTQGIPDCLRETETKILRGMWVAETALKLRGQGYIPDLILAHPGWGEAIFLRDVWPHCPQLHYLEFDYSYRADASFDPEFHEEPDLSRLMIQRLKTSSALLSYQSMSWGYTPTHFQWQTLPRFSRAQVSVIHDGIDCQTLRPDDQAELQLADGTRFRKGDPVLTFVNRTFEPYRGIHKLMRALPKLQQLWPQMQVLLVGADTAKVSYGKNRDDGRGWLSVMREELGDQLDWNRIHVPGPLAHNDFIRAMQISAVHVYLTYPFVLSWSLLEAMACGAIVIGSATEPVQEVIQHGENGLLVDFHDQQALITMVSAVLSEPADFLKMRKNARQTIKKNYQLQTCLQKQLALVDAVANRVIGLH